MKMMTQFASATRGGGCSGGEWLRTLELSMDPWQSNRQSLTGWFCISRSFRCKYLALVPDPSRFQATMAAQSLEVDVAALNLAIGTSSAASFSVLRRGVSSWCRNLRNNQHLLGLKDIQSLFLRHWKGAIAC